MQSRKIAPAASDAPNVAGNYAHIGKVRQGKELISSIASLMVDVHWALVPRDSAHRTLTQ